MINITSTDLPEQILLKCHEATAIPGIIISYILFSLIFLIVGYSMLNSREGRKNFRNIWILATIMSGIISIGIIYMPNQIQNISNFFINILNLNLWINVKY